MNRIILKGNISQDINVNKSANGSTVARFNIAVNRRFKREGEPDTDFFSCVAFGKPAETIEKYLKKGSPILVEGRLQNFSYVNKDGQTIRGNDIIVEAFDFIGGKENGGNAQAPAQEASTDSFMNVPEEFDDELPFA